MTRRLEIKEQKRLGTMIFELIDNKTDEILATVRSTPYQVKLYKKNDESLVLTPDERLFCLLETAKQVKG